MDMEVLIFVILADFWIAAFLILIGIVIGKAHSAYNQESHKNVPGDVLQGDSDIRIYHRGDYHKFDCFVGNVHGEKSRGCNSGSSCYRDGSSCYRDGKITDECTVNALRQIRRDMRMMLSQTEKDALENSADTIEMMLEFRPTILSMIDTEESLIRLCALTGMSTDDIETAIMKGNIQVITREEHEKMHKGIK